MLRFEIAGTLIQLEDDESALVVYCNETWRGIPIELCCVEGKSLKSQVISRPFGNETVYAAVFPRILLPNQSVTFRYEISGGLRRDNSSSSGASFNKESVTFFAGNVTELDWTEKKIDFR